MIAESVINEISAAIDIIDIVGGFINLKRRGANYLGICPFHDEKTPSFTVSPVKGIYKCFGCGRSGNAISFIMEHEKLSYVEAIRWLAAKYDITIQETGGWTPAYNEASSLHIVNQFAADYFADRLQSAKDYFTKRGFTASSIKKFHLGYDDGGLATAAKEKQHNPDLLKRAGLVNEKGEDNYRGRAIFPINSPAGKIIGFGARKLQESDFGPKYLNTPDNDAYNKSKTLYGLHQAGREISKQDECLLVEGYTDVISLHQGGIENVVASSGTSLTTGQLQLIKKYTNHLTIIYDGDEAGRKAALRGFDLALTEGVRTKGVILPDGHDPDSYMKEAGPAAFREYVAAEKKEIVVIQLQLLLASSDDPGKRADVINVIAGSIAKITRPEDFSLRQDYISRCSQMLGVDELGLLNLVNQISGNAAPTPAPIALVPPADDNVAEKTIIKVLLEHGDKQWQQVTVGHFIVQEFEDNDLLDLMDNESYCKIVAEYKSYLVEGILPENNLFLYHADQGISTTTASVLSDQETLSVKWKEYFKGTLDHDKLYQQEVISSLSYLKLRKVKKLLKQNQEDLKTETDSEQQTIMVKAHQHLKKLEVELSNQLGAVILPFK